MTPEDETAWFARVAAALDDDGRLPAMVGDSVARWDAFPFELADDARTRPVVGLADVDRPREGEDCATCSCHDVDPTDGSIPTAVAGTVEAGPNAVWRNESWLVRRFDRVGLPIIMMLWPHAHHDFTDLPDDLATELGLLTVRLAAAIETLPSVGRCHVSRWGDGGAHAHVWFLGRPLRHPQVMGSVAVVWDDLLPALPDDVRDANARAVVAELVRRHGGQALGVARS